MTNSEALDFWDYAIRFAMSKNLFHEAEDFAVTAIIAAVEDGRSSTSLKWAWADYNRIKWGNRKTMVGRAKEEAMANTLRLTASGGIAESEDVRVENGGEKFVVTEIPDDRESNVIEMFESENLFWWNEVCLCFRS